MSNGLKVKSTWLSSTIGYIINKINGMIFLNKKAQVIWIIMKINVHNPASANLVFIIVNFKIK